MKAKIVLKNEIELDGELRMMGEYTLTIRVQNIDAPTMAKLYDMHASATKLSSIWSVNITRDSITSIKMYE